MSCNFRACDKLRCTDCDFKICMFDNFVWDSATDYLFLRNNIPDFSKLKSKLKPKSGNKIQIYPTLMHINLLLTGIK